MDGFKLSMSKDLEKKFSYLTNDDHQATRSYRPEKFEHKVEAIVLLCIVRLRIPPVHESKLFECVVPVTANVPR